MYSHHHLNRSLYCSSMRSNPREDDVQLRKELLGQRHRKGCAWQDNFKHIHSYNGLRTLKFSQHLFHLRCDCVSEQRHPIASVVITAANPKICRLIPAQAAVGVVVAKAQTFTFLMNHSVHIKHRNALCFHHSNSLRVQLRDREVGGAAPRRAGVWRRRFRRCVRDTTS